VECDCGSAGLLFMMVVRADNVASGEAVLVKQAKAGDVASFEALYRAYSRRIYNFARQVVGSDADAADVAQETFVRAWKSLPRLRDELAFCGWLYRIALNQSNGVLSRRKRAEVSFDGESPELCSIATNEVGPEDAALDSETTAVLDKAISELSPEHRAAVAMHHLQGMDVADVARALCVPQGTILSRLARARAVLRRKLAPYLEISDG
jgi:RNA polymerase sigma-70 factor, ECF subfamily